MPKAVKAFVRGVDALNRGVGRVAMYILFVMMAILMWSAISKAAFTPSGWTLEMAQFAMVAYYVLGGPWTMQEGGHVRMDLFYARQSHRTRALWDAVTVLALIVYLGIMIWGALDSTIYSFAYNERSPTAWRPYLWPIKVVMLTGFVLMLLQALSSLIRDIATLRGETI